LKFPPAVLPGAIIEMRMTGDLILTSRRVYRPFT
jgi:hypothetical protein